MANLCTVSGSITTVCKNYLDWSFYLQTENTILNHADTIVNRGKPHSSAVVMDWQIERWTEQKLIYRLKSVGTLRLSKKVKLKNFADLDFDLDPNWGITPKIETWLIYKNIEDLDSE